MDPVEVEVNQSTDFVRRVMTNGQVLPVGRGIALARLLCRADIVNHLAQHGTNVREGRLPAHIQAVATSTESLMLNAARERRVAWANQRHDETGVTKAQRLYVWAAFVDGYWVGIERAGFRTTPREVAEFMASAHTFGAAFGLTCLPRLPIQVAQFIDNQMEGIPEETVSPGGWCQLSQVARSDWFASDLALPLGDVVAAVEARMPQHLIAALQR